MAGQGASNGDIPVTCSVAAETGILSCSTAIGHKKILMCGLYLYLAITSFVMTSCTEMCLKLSPWLS